jgi:hypothetical protein
MDPLRECLGGLLDGSLSLLACLHHLRADGFLGSGNGLEFSGQLPHAGAQVPQARLKVGQDSLSQVLPGPAAENEPQCRYAEQNQESQHRQQNQEGTF